MHCQQIRFRGQTVTTQSYIQTHLYPIQCFILDFFSEKQWYCVTDQPRTRTDAPKSALPLCAAATDLDPVGKHEDAWGVPQPFCCSLDGSQVLQQLGRLLVLCTHLHHLQAAYVAYGWW